MILGFVRSYFSCLDTRKVTKESQEIPNRSGEPPRSAQTAEFRNLLSLEYLRKEDYQIVIKIRRHFEKVTFSQNYQDLWRNTICEG